MWRVLHVRRMSCTRIFLFLSLSLLSLLLSLVAGKWLSAGAVVLFESGLSFAERYIGGESLAATLCIRGFNWHAYRRGIEAIMHAENDRNLRRQKGIISSFSACEPTRNIGTYIYIYIFKRNERGKRIFFRFVPFHSTVRSVRPTIEREAE